MTNAAIILVPGFWLGAWAWDEVAEALRARGYHVSALTLPGLDAQDTDRSTITLTDHVEAIVAAIRAAEVPVVLAVHSASGLSGYAATAKVPDRVAAVVYVDSAPGKGALDPEFPEVEKPLVWSEIEEEENLDGLTEEQKETFRRRAVPEPGGVLREAVELTNDARFGIPSTIICTGYPTDMVKAYAADTDWAWLAGVRELRDVRWLDLPTSHWPMWSRPDDLASLIADVAERASRA